MNQSNVRIVKTDKNCEEYADQCMSRQTSSSALKTDILDIFSDKKWEDNNLDTAFKYDGTVDFSNLEPSTTQDKITTVLEYMNKSGKDQQEVNFKSVSKYSRLQQPSDASSDYFELVEVESADYNTTELANAYEEVNDDLLLQGLPNPSSFIMPKRKDSFLVKFLDENQGKNDITSSIAELTDKPSRMKRWLKNQDRKMFNIIYTNKKSEAFDKTTLQANLDRDETKASWMTIKNTLNTDRSLDFLQDRYNKLLLNQKLNRKERDLLSDKYDRISIDNFMVIFPGKTRQTLEKLVEDLRDKDAKAKLSTKTFDITVENVYINDCSSVCISKRTDQNMNMEIDLLKNLNSSAYLKNLDKKTLNGLSDCIKELVWKAQKNSECAKQRILTSIQH